MPTEGESLPWTARPSPFRNYLHLEAVQWRGEAATCILRVHERVCNDDGTVANGVIFTLIDVVSAEAVRRHVGGEQVRLSTLDAKVIWLAPLRTDAEASARVLHIADRIAAVDAQVVELATGRPIACALASFYVTR
ncbi:MAG TPA: PaaI family thioesterase [Limnochordales bacterium]